MNISTKAWADFVKKLSQLDETATNKVGDYITNYNGFDYENAEHMKDLVGYAFSISNKYGEAAAALACEMYDAVGTGSGLFLPPASPAETAKYRDVAKAVYGTAKNRNTNMVAGSVGRLVKRTGQDTILTNALRDGAQFAWVPNGDTCAFCLTLASRGWQKMSRKALKNGHAEHIHSNCDCTYAVRFDNKTQVPGYDPEVYRQMYDNSEGGSPNEKINALRRAIYEKNREKINAQKRANYAAVKFDNNSVEKAKKNIIEKLTNKNGNEVISGDKILSKIHDDMIDAYKLNLLKSNEYNGVYVDYPEKMITKEAAKAFNDAAVRVNSKFITSLEHISPWDSKTSLMYKSMGAGTWHNYDVSSSTINYNPLWVGNNEKLTQKISELIESGKFVKVDEKDYINYVAVHETGHTIISFEDKLLRGQNLVGEDMNRVINARKEINVLFEEYKTEVERLDTIRTAKGIEALSSFDEGVWAESAAAEMAYNNTIISKYSLEKVDEFVAESYTNVEIGTEKNEYAQRCYDILLKYFGR